MAEADFTALTAATNNALDAASVSKGVTGPLTFTPPNGGSNFVLGFHALQAAIGVSGFYYSSDSSFNPIAPNKGGIISAAMRRYSAGSGYAPFIGFVAGTDMQASYAYMLGLSNSDPFQIVLVKGIPGNGIDASDATALRVSDSSFSSTTEWFHLRLSVLVNPQGDVRLLCEYNDLLAHTVTAPTWASIPGMDVFTDDANGILTGAVPLTSSFRAMFGQYNEGTGKVSLFDQISVARQISP